MVEMGFAEVGRGFAWSWVLVTSLIALSCWLIFPLTFSNRPANFVLSPSAPVAGCPISIKCEPCCKRSPWFLPSDFKRLHLLSFLVVNSTISHFIREKSLPLFHLCNITKQVFGDSKPIRTLPLHRHNRCSAIIWLQRPLKSVYK